MMIGRKDARVLRAFSEQKPEVGHKLTTDGVRLDGLWMGGTGIAAWSGGKIELGDLGSKTSQSVQRSLLAYVAPNDIRKSNPMTKPRKNPGKVLATTIDDRELLLGALECAVYEIQNRRRRGETISRAEAEYQERLEEMYNRIAEL